MSGIAVEWAPFTLADGAEEERLLRASEALQKDFLGRQAGFIRRELLRGPNGQWVDIVHWESAEAAESAMRNVAESPVCQEYFHLMKAADHNDPAGGVTLFALRRSYERAAA